VCLTRIKLPALLWVAQNGVPCCQLLELFLRIGPVRFLDLVRICNAITCSSYVHRFMQGGRANCHFWHDNSIA